MHKCIGYVFVFFYYLGEGGRKMSKEKKIVTHKVGTANRDLQEEIERKKYDELYEEAWLSRNQKPDTEFNRNTTTWD